MTREEEGRPGAQEEEIIDPKDGLGPEEDDDNASGDEGAEDGVGGGEEDGGEKEPVDEGGVPLKNRLAEERRKREDLERRLDLQEEQTNFFKNQLEEKGKPKKPPKEEALPPLVTKEEWLEVREDYDKTIDLFNRQAEAIAARETRKLEQKYVKRTEQQTSYQRAITNVLDLAHKDFSASGFGDVLDASGQPDTSSELWIRADKIFREDGLVKMGPNGMYRALALASKELRSGEKAPDRPKKKEIEDAHGSMGKGGSHKKGSKSPAKKGGKFHRILNRAEIAELESDEDREDYELYAMRERMANRR